MKRSRSGVAGSPDARRVQRQAVKVGLSVALASLVIVGLITLATVVVIVSGSRVDVGDGRRGDRVVAVEDVVPFIIVLGAVGIVILSLFAWYVARRAALPMAEALRVQRAFVADASHELRTPLTTLTSRIQLAEHRAEHGGDVMSSLEQLRRDAAVMDSVLTDLLLAAEAAGGRAPDARSSAAVDEAVEAAVESLEPRAGEGRVAIAVDVPAGMDVAADASALARALVALLDNAVRHSPPGSTVTVSARSVRGRVELRVADQGGGVTGIDPDRLFDRFVRRDDGSSRRGFGLGLALVSDIAARFGGDVSVESTSSDGATFLLVLPVPRR